jgi:magnesium chelatase family protein
MLSRISSAAVYGVDAAPVEIEVHVSSGGNGEIQIVGLPDTAVRESRARVVAAIRNSGFDVPHQRITISLAPAGLRKEGAAFDLPIAIGILASTGCITGTHCGPLLVGELALDGRLRPVRGVLPVALLARDRKVPALIVPNDNHREAALAQGVTVRACQTLAEVVAFVNGTAAGTPPDREPPPVPDIRSHLECAAHAGEDFAEVQGQPQARRAIEVAIAGGHNILMVGSPGAGKTMLARRIPSIMPPMTVDECLESTRIYSVAGLLPTGTGLVANRPFRAPHHTVSDRGLVGGGAVPRPGEVSLAHNGVLFLDELPEFRRHVLEVLRQPLEERRVTIARAQMTLSFPAHILLVAAMNACPCSYLGDERHPCSCTPGQIQRYMSRISGPLLDRIDIRVHVPRVSYVEMTDKRSAESSAAIRERIVAARQIQTERFEGSGTRSNAVMTSLQLKAYCPLDAPCDRLMEQAIDRLSISARGYTRLLKVARTIADLEGAASIRPSDIAEAVRYRDVGSGG